MWEYIKSLYNSDDICVHIALAAVIIIIFLLVLKNIVNNYFIEKFTDQDGYENFAYKAMYNARSSENDGKVDPSLGYPTEVKVEEETIKMEEF
jgi:hypothetical protein